MDDDWDFDAMLDEEEREQEALNQRSNPSGEHGDMDETMEEEPQPPTQPSSSPPSQMPSSPIIEDEFAEDEAMWDMIAEIEGS